MVRGNKIYHILSDNIVRFVTETEFDCSEYDAWRQSRRLPHDSDFGRATRPRVWVGHFHSDNYMIW